MRDTTRSRLKRSGGLLLIALLPLIMMLSCEESTGPGVSTQTVSRKILIYSDASAITTNGGSAQILVKVYADDDTTNVASGVKVSFTANQNGTLQVQNEITDANGYAPHSSMPEPAPAQRQLPLPLRIIPIPCLLLWCRALVL